MSDAGHFDLEITFIGLCLFVRDPRTSPTTMHVLMPDVCSTGHHHRIEPHICRLDFPARNHPEGGTRDERLALNLWRQSVHLRNVGGTMEQERLPESIGMLPGRVCAAVLDGFRSGPGNALQPAARMKLQSGRIESTPRGGLFSYRGEPRNLTFSVRWVIRGVRGEELVLGFSGIRGAPALPPLRLHPTTDGGGRRTVPITVLCLPESELPERMPDGPCAALGNAPCNIHHFAGFAPLLAGAGTIDLPRSLGSPSQADCEAVAWNVDGTQAEAANGVAAPFMAGRPYTCVVGGGEAPE